MTFDVIDKQVSINELFQLKSARFLYFFRVYLQVYIYECPSYHSERLSFNNRSMYFDYSMFVQYKSLEIFH